MSRCRTSTFPTAPIRAVRSGLTEAEVQRAAELEAEATAKEKRRSPSRSGAGTARSPARTPHATGDINAPLSVRAAHEYAYVSRDVKRIAVTGGLMLGILAVLHVLVNVMKVITF